MHTWNYVWMYVCGYDIVNRFVLNDGVTYRTQAWNYSRISQYLTHNDNIKSSIYYENNYI